MTYHEWGDLDFDWKALNDAGNFIYDSTRWSRIGFHYKEKYGTLRASVFLFDGSLHSLIWPGYAYIQYRSRAMDWVDREIIQPILNFLAGKLVRRLQMWNLKRAYLKAIIRWPHIKEEILEDSEFYESEGKIIWKPFF